MEPSTLALDKCPKCGVPASQSLRFCPTCGNDLGCPNVRAAMDSIEAGALEGRFTLAHAKANKRGLTAEFTALVSTVTSESHVVVAMPLLCARSFLNDPRVLYAGYESLVGAGNRLPSPFGNDSERHAVSANLFGSYASEIRYGVLSLDGAGLPNYGLCS